MTRADGDWWADPDGSGDFRPVEVWSDADGGCFVETRGSAGLEQLAIDDLPEDWVWGPPCVMATFDPVSLVQVQRDGLWVAHKAFPDGGMAERYCAMHSELAAFRTWEVRDLALLIGVWTAMADDVTAVVA